MNDNDVVQYLANVLAVARSDDVLGPQEEAAIEQVRTDIGAKKKDLKDAQKLAEREDSQPVPVGRYSERIRNLEDMVFIALVDRELDPSEKQTILGFAKQLEVTQDQVTQNAGAPSLQPQHARERKWRSITPRAGSPSSSQNPRQRLSIAHSKSPEAPRGSRNVSVPARDGSLPVGLRPTFPRRSLSQSISRAFATVKRT